MESQAVEQKKQSLISLGIISKNLIAQSQLPKHKLLELLQKLYVFRHHTPKIKIKYDWQLRALTGELDLKSLDINNLPADINNTNIAHYLAWAGDLDGLQYLKEKTPDILEKKNRFGYNIAHFAAMSCNLKVLQWIKDNYYSCFNQKTYDHVPPGYYAGLSGNIDALEWFNKEGLLSYEQTINGQILSHYVALSGNTEALTWLINNRDIESLGTANNVGASSAHYAAWGGSAKALEWFEKNAKKLLYQGINNGQNIFHYAALSGNLEALQWCNENLSALGNRKTNHGVNTAHFAAMSGVEEAYEWVVEKKPNLLDTKTNFGLSPVDYAALSGNRLLLNKVIACSKKPDRVTIHNIVVDLNKAMQTLLEALDTNFMVTEVKLPDNVDLDIKKRILEKIARNCDIQNGRGAFLAFAAAFYRKDSSISVLPIEILQKIYASYLPAGLPAEYINNSFNKIMDKLSPSGRLSNKIKLVEELLEKEIKSSNGNKLLNTFQQEFQESCKSSICQTTTNFTGGDN